MFQKCINLNAAMPPNPEDLEPKKLPLLAYTEMGHAQRKQDKLLQAIDSYTKVLEIDPSSAEIAGLLGKLYYIQGNNSMALEFLGFALEVATEDVMKSKAEFIADLYLQRVKVYESLNMHEHARADQKKILEVDPNFVQRQMVRQQKAEQALAEALEDNLRL